MNTIMRACLSPKLTAAKIRWPGKTSRSWRFKRSGFEDILSILQRASAISRDSNIRIMFRWVAFVVLFSFVVDLSVCGQSSSPALLSPDVGPETAFLSPSRYTNAFFGFSISLPQNTDLREKTLSLNRGTRDHLLIGFHAPSEQLITFAITARDVPEGSEKEASKISAGPDSSRPEKTTIGGRTFWRSQSPRKLGHRNMQTVIFSTAMNNYVLQFKVISFNPEITMEIEQNIEKLTFFDPSEAKVIAGADSKPYTPGASKFATNPIGQLSTGSVSGNVYRNEALGFCYEFPRGWVLMSKAHEEAVADAEHQFIWGNSPTAQQEHESATQCTKNLLFVRHSLEASKDGQFNSMVLLIAVDPKCAPGSRFPKGVDDREAIQQIARQTVQYFMTATMSSTEPARVRAFNNAGRIMVEISESFTVSLSGQTDPTNILSSMLMMQAGDYWVIWMFAAKDKTELAELRNTKIFFGDPVAPVIQPKASP